MRDNRVSRGRSRNDLEDESSDSDRSASPEVDHQQQQQRQASCHSHFTKEEDIALLEGICAKGVGNWQALLVYLHQSCKDLTRVQVCFYHQPQSTHFSRNMMPSSDALIASRKNHGSLRAHQPSTGQLHVTCQNARRKRK